MSDPYPIQVLMAAHERLSEMFDTDVYAGREDVKEALVADIEALDHAIELLRNAARDEE